MEESLKKLGEGIFLIWIFDEALDIEAPSDELTIYDCGLAVCVLCHTLRLDFVLFI